MHAIIIPTYAYIEINKSVPYPFQEKNVNHFTVCTKLKIDLKGNK